MVFKLKSYLYAPQPSDTQTTPIINQEARFTLRSGKQGWVLREVIIVHGLLKHQEKIEYEDENLFQT